jgi:hypothetical protein
MLSPPYPKKSQQEEFQCNQERDRRVNYRFATLPSSSPKIIRSGDFHSPQCCHTCVPPVYNYFGASPLRIHTVNCQERLCISISAALNSIPIFY